MAQTGFTPVQLYHSTTAAATPSAGNLAAGELAVNITDGKLFYKDNGGVVRVLATAAGSAGDVVGPGSSTDNALVRFDGTTGKLVQSSVGVLSDAGALSGLTSVAATTFTGTLTGNASTATTLQTSRTIWGQSFDGSANVTGALTGVTDLTASGSLTLSGGTANGVAYLNGSKVLTTGSALTFNGTSFGVPNIDLNNGGILNLYSTGFGSYFQLTNNANALTFGYNGSEVARMTSGGLVVGSTTVPTVGSTAMLAVGNTNGGTQAITQSGSIVYRTSASTSGVDFYNPNASPMQWYTSGISRLQLDAVGKLGLGTAATTVFDAYSADQGIIRIKGGSASNQGGAFYVASATTANTLSAFGDWARINGGTVDQATAVYSLGTAPLLFAVGSERGRFDTSGNFLVATTSSNPAGARVLGFSIKTNGSISSRTASSNTDWGINSTSGNVHNFYSDNGSAIVYAGSISVNGIVTTYGSVSDYRAKIVIGKVSDSGDRIDLLEPIEYAWKSNGERTRGFLAHKFQEVYPQSVSGNKDATDKNGNPVYQIMQPGTSEVIADLVAEIQSLRKRLAAAGIA